MRASIEAQWYHRPTWLWLLFPLVPLFRCLSALRRWHYTKGAHRLRVPVVVIGNITLGGTGKTPLLMALVKHLHAQGYKPGVVSRGYGGTFQTPTLDVTAASQASLCGDEPLLIAQRCQCPVVVGQQRVLAAQRLIDEFGCDIIVSDDGLQHYALARDIEIVVLDASRGLGNGWSLPMGPLREPPARLGEVDWVMHNGGSTPYGFQLVPQHWISVAQKVMLPLLPLPWGDSPNLFAIAGIGHPQRFFNTLQGLGLHTRNRAFADHQAFRPDDLAFSGNNPLLMTAKDAVKCQSFAAPNWWALDVAAELSGKFLTEFDQRLAVIQQTKIEECS